MSRLSGLSAFLVRARNRLLLGAFTSRCSHSKSSKLKRRCNPVGSKVRLLQVLIILFAVAGVFAVQSVRPRPGVLTNAS